MATQFRAARFTAQEALQFHAGGKPGKLEITPTKPLATQRDLALAYSPGVAVPVQAIAHNPADVYAYTNKGNLVAVVSNGTAILGLGNLGALASKPVMEGKAALFKRFADIDSIDLLVDTEDVEAFINSVRYLGPSFGGINLEDIKAPDCFIIEERLKALLDIPVFHDDQHGTAIVVAAGVLNGLKVVGKDIAKVKLVCAGAGAAALACLNLLLKIGLKRENVFVSDIEGVVYEGRTKLMDPYKAPFAQKTKARHLAEVMKGVDLSPLFLGWLIATIIRVCLGSATVAGLTTAGIVAPVVAAGGVDPNLMVLAVGAGSLMFSHVNDSGFWLFKEYFNLSLKDTLRSWTMMETIVGTVGLIGVLVLDLFV